MGDQKFEEKRRDDRRSMERRGGGTNQSVEDIFLDSGNAEKSQIKDHPDMRNGERRKIIRRLVDRELHDEITAG